MRHLTTGVLILASGLTASAPALAQSISRYETANLTCDQAQAAVLREGAVILRYRSPRNPTLPLYDRYVASRAYCQPTEGLYWDYIPTADTGGCPVATCKEIIYND